MVINMTDTTDIKALRDVKRYGTKATGNEHFKYVTAEMTDGPWVKQEDYFALLTLLEAERQRADDAHKYGSERDAENESLMLTVGRLRVEIAELKGEQVPIAWLNDAHLARGHIEGEAGEEDAGPGMIPVYREKFTAQQKPVLHPDTKRMDWLCAHAVEVRDPQMYGSHAMFHAQQDSEEWDLPHHTTLREQVDAAIEAAGGIVSTSDERLMQDMSDIVKDGE